MFFLPRKEKKHWHSRPIKKYKRKKHFRFLRFLFVFTIILILGIVGIGSFIFIWINKSLPNPQKLVQRNLIESTKIYDRTGKILLYEIFNKKRRTLVDISQIPQYLVEATICAEDKNFYRHSGFDLKAMTRAMLVNILGRGKIEGGSTITQQFIKNAFLTPKKTYIRKIKELILAYQIEKKFSKQEILQMYFNEIPYGSNTYGAEEASQFYFGKSVKNLTLDESAFLASLPKAPTYYSPYGEHQDELINRRNYILNLMTKENYITLTEAQNAKNQDTLKKIITRHNKIIAPHFVMYVKEQLTEKYGERQVEQGGLKVITTLDVPKQKIAEAAINKYAERNEKQFNATNESLVAIDVQTGQILSMVGSRDFSNTKIDGQVNIALRPRQPGSSFKPIVYAAAFEKGYTPQTLLFDAKTNFGPQGPKKEDYIPQNYNNKYHGLVTIKKALAGSLNVCAVKALYLTGLNPVLNLAQKMGYTTLNQSTHYGLSLALGGGEVKLLDHVSAYSIFAREGKKIEPYAILEVKDAKNQTLYKYKPKQPQEVIKPQICQEINNILSDNDARKFVFGEKNYLNLSQRPVAAKTGTTNDFHDAWTIGYTPSLAAGVWVGNSRNEVMKEGSDGATIAAPIWHEFMQNALQGTDIKNFTPPQPENIEKPILRGEIPNDITVKIDKASGKLATDLTPKKFIEEKTFKGYHSILYFVDKDNPQGPIPENPKADPQFSYWEDGINQWLKEQGNNLEIAPTEYDDVHIPANKPTLEILSPSNGANIFDSILTIKSKASSKRGIKKIECSLDGYLLNTIYSYPFECNMNLSGLSQGAHQIMINACDDIDNCTSKKIWINTSHISGGKFFWLSPKNGQTIQQKNFPLTVSVLIFPTSIKKIQFFVKNLETNNSQLLGTIFNPQNSGEFDMSWGNAQTGNYELWVETISLNGEKDISKKIEVSIK